MKTVVPEYYLKFKCIASKCRHTCCRGWEIDVDEASLPRFLSSPDIAPRISTTDTPHIILSEGERCPFLTDSGLCRMIIDHDEDMLCDICRDHPRFRSFWTDRTEIGLGMVCEEACRIILSEPLPMKLIVIEDDGEDAEMPEDEKWLTAYRVELLSRITETGARARILEYLIFRHIPDALYDDMTEERTAFVYSAYREIISAWEQTDGTFDDLVECCRQFSYDVEYDDEVLAQRIRGE